MNRKLTKILVVLLAMSFLIVFVGCPQYTKAQNDKDVYFKALGFWTDTYANFKFVYENSTPTQQKEMIKSMAYLLEVKQNALNPWKVALDGQNQGDIYNQERAWKSYEDKIILSIVNKYLTKKGGTL